MGRCQNFAKSLDAIRTLRSVNLTAFSEELGIPKSTLQTILKDGNTSLHTALNIADRLKVPLSSLTDAVVSEDELASIAPLLQCFQWFDRLPKEDREKVAFHINAILEVLQK